MASETGKGTADALYCIRKIITAGESTKTPAYLLLLDWAEAFDKIIHKGLIAALYKMKIHPK